MTASELRQKYLDFFKNKDHAVISGASLIPENDPTTLFTSSGMQPMVPYLLGEKHPEGVRLTDSQKCFRASDIDDVGDNRHTTFFEMLGNWSLGDYFQEEQISWIFEFLTKELKLDPHRLYMTVYRGNDKFGIPKDDKAAALWQAEFKKVGIDAEVVEDAVERGLQGGRIFYFDEKENWWSRAGLPESMPLGEPGGFDSEMFWDMGEQLGLHEKSIYKDNPCTPACDCGRFIEIGNNVFMQYIKTDNGFEELKNKNIDFGGGLERMAMAIADNPDIYMCDIFLNLRKKIEEISGRKYREDKEELKSFRVIMDHLRGATFLIGDGAIPDNKDQGYFTRRLIRRAVRFAYGLGIKNNFTKEIAKVIIQDYADYYVELKKGEQLILEELDKEESKFRKTLVQGEKEFMKWAMTSSSAQGMIPGKVAFDLFQSYGYPLEMTIEMAAEKGKTVDVKSFVVELKKHQDLSRTASAGKFKGGLADSDEETTKLHTTAHLLLAALRKVLGDHVVQRGSNITSERLRLDFSQGEPMTPEQIVETEALVNQAIASDLKVTCEEVSIEEAKARGAMGVFDSKYGEKVKVYTVCHLGEDFKKAFSQEICGGPHVDNTGILGHFRIVKESSSSAGVRRIKAVLEN